MNTEKTPNFSRKARFYNLDRISLLLGFLGNPHKNLKIIHVAGSKGKSSTATMIASILTEAGEKTGLFTSPHLTSPCERSQIDRQNISEDRFAELAALLKPHVEQISEKYQIGKLSFFEFYTALSLLDFSAQAVDFAVIETGLGGRLDATNVVDPILSVITPISLEHTKILGATLPEIALEKAQIIKPNRPVVVAPQNDEKVKSLFHRVAQQRNSKIRHVDRSKIIARRQSENGQIFQVDTGKNSYDDLFIPLNGSHQILNATTAICCVEEILDRSSSAIRNALKNLKISGRGELVEGKPKMFLDVAHTPESIGALKKTIDEICRYDRAIMVVSIMRDKDLRGIGEILCPMAQELIVTEVFDNPRVYRSEEILNCWSDLHSSIRQIPSVKEALRTARSMASDKDLLVITGSTYLVGEIFCTM